MTLHESMLFGNAVGESLAGAAVDDERVSKRCRWKSKKTATILTIARVTGADVEAVDQNGRGRRMSVLSLKNNYIYLDAGLSDNAPPTNTGAQMTTVTVRMTPENAALFVDVMGANRDVSKTNLSNLKKDMLDGRFELTHQSIAFNRQGNLIDGQHRCLACKETGVTVYQRVTYFPGSPVASLIESIAVQESADLRVGGPIDSGLRRGIAGQIQIGNGGAAGGKSKTAWARIESLAKATEFMYANLDSYGARRMSLPPMSAAVVENTYSRFQAEYDWFLSRTNNKFNSSVGAVVALAFGVWPDHMERFVAQLVTGENIPTNGPAGRIRDQMLDYKRSHGNQARLRLMLMTANAVHLFAKGKTSKQITRLKNEALCELVQARKDAGKP